MMGREVVIVAAARTAIGRYGGSLRNVHPAELGAVTARAVLARAGVEPQAVDEVIFGHGRQAGSGPNPARQVVRRAGLPDEVPAQTINQACASGLQSAALGAQAIQLGRADVIVAGGMESMSRMPYMLDSEDARWGHRMGHMTLFDAMYRDGFSCPLAGMIMGETAELLAHDKGITREASDRYALGSQQKAEAAIKAGLFVEEIAPVALEDGRAGVREFDQDEHPRFGTTLESLARLPVVFRSVEGHPGIITAGSASGITDGAAAVLLASGERAASIGRRPLARIIDWATAGVEPRMMGIGPVPAVRKLFARTGLTLDDFDLVELNEAFAAQVLAVLRELPVPEEKLNVNGGAIALGHPIGCSGARILVTLLYAMRHRGARLGLATLCVSGGLGMAMAVESM